MSAIVRSIVLHPVQAAVTKQLAEAIDELRDAASAVRTLAQAAIGDIEEDLGRSKDDYKRFVQETLLASVPVASGYDQVRAGHHQLRAWRHQPRAWREWFYLPRLQRNSSWVAHRRWTRSI